jgi:hypothetical protein
MTSKQKGSEGGMSDDELAKFLGIVGEPNAQRYIDGLSPEKRAVINRMATVETELALWEAGLGPKPQGAISCKDHKHK